MLLYPCPFIPWSFPCLENLFEFIIPSPMNNISPYIQIPSNPFPPSFFHNSFIPYKIVHKLQEKSPVFINPNSKSHIIKANIKILAPKDRSGTWGMDACGSLWASRQRSREAQMCAGKKVPELLLCIQLMPDMGWVPAVPFWLGLKDSLAW